MAEPTRQLLERQLREGITACRGGLDVVRRLGPGQVQFWFLALAIGVLAGLATLSFRWGISSLQTLFYGTDDINLASAARDLPWYVVLSLPVVGGLVVGVILHRMTDDGRARSVADVIEGAAMRDGRVEHKAGLASMLASLITLSTGGSAGREGPVVHFAGVMSSWISDRLAASGMTARDLMGCAVAAAVSASFNAPIAGALFALEVVLRHFAVHAFAPIVIASVAGTVVNRLAHGNVTEFTLPVTSTLQFYVELPAYLILGAVCGLVAVILIRLVFWAEDLGTHVTEATGLPRWLRPAVAGLMLGLIAIPFPHIIGVGYETTSAALTGGLVLAQAFLFVIFKIIAVALTMAGRMGGGIFSPSLMVGALTGLSFGYVATAIFPDVSGSETLYALAGMGAVSAAVLGAPISTTLIVFELTGDWQTGLAVMVAVSLSTALASRMVDRSFFLTQLKRRGVHLAAGPQAYLLAMFRVGTVMRPSDAANAADEARCLALIEEGTYLIGDVTLERAMPMFEETGLEFLPIVKPSADPGGPELWGALFHVDALKAYNRALASTAQEEHS